MTMKHLYTIINNLPKLAIAALLAAPTMSNAQCLTWVNPTDSSGWSDFVTTFNGAPCATSGVCPVNEITAFQVWADEAYAMTNVQAGGTYTFSACNGAGGGAWPLSFTIINPSGTPDAFGLDAGSSCALTWTATETGTYLIVVSEQGACGTSSNQSTDNGFPSITCTASAATDCATIGIDETAAQGPVLNSPNPTTGLFTVTVSAEARRSEVLGLNGRLLQGVTTTRTLGGTYHMDLSGLAAGTYMVRTDLGTTVNTQRITLVD